MSNRYEIPSEDSRTRGKEDSPVKGTGYSVREDRVRGVGFSIQIVNQRLPGSPGVEQDCFDSSAGESATGKIGPQLLESLGEQLALAQKRKQRALVRVDECSRQIAQLEQQINEVYMELGDILD